MSALRNSAGLILSLSRSHTIFRSSWRLSNKAISSKGTPEEHLDERNSGLAGRESA